MSGTCGVNTQKICKTTVLCLFTVNFTSSRSIAVSISIVCYFLYTTKKQWLARGGEKNTIWAASHAEISPHTKRPAFKLKYDNGRISDNLEANDSNRSLLSVCRVRLQRRGNEGKHILTTLRCALMNVCFRPFCNSAQ